MGVISVDKMQNGTQTKCTEGTFDKKGYLEKIAKDVNDGMYSIDDVKRAIDLEAEDRRKNAPLSLTEDQLDDIIYSSISDRIRNDSAWIVDQLGVTLDKEFNDKIGKIIEKHNTMAKFVGISFALSIISICASIFLIINAII